MSDPLIPLSENIPEGATFAMSLFHYLPLFDGELLSIITLSLFVSLSAVTIASLIGFPLGVLLALAKFPGRNAVMACVNAMMGLPPVVVGLVVYMLLSNSGPLGAFRLLYTPAAMIFAQSVLVIPIIVALSAEIFGTLAREYDELFRSMCVRVYDAVIAILWDARAHLPIIALAGFGRAIAEVGAVIMVGGNIKDFTRVMTGAIVLETSKGELALALSLGLVLLAVALTVNILIMLFRSRSINAAG